ncbi:two-component sensor histidine kinase [Acidovorax sp. sif1233]|uniref:sensor histidine kinase n=1 Tax=Acidovorax sp. sif1233 TaxID=2854792 RepID=UPI001C46C56A|nr:ATP-binding protein [Acidovorax sp. sif1233]MBV7455714.1 two-component sensor histidine kinase [Acidovorax sp. sif1233]
MTGPVREHAARWYRPRSLRGQILLWLAPWILVGAVVAGCAFWASYSALIHTFMQYQMEVLARSPAAGGQGPAGTSDGGDGRDAGHGVEPLPLLSDTNILDWGAFAVQVWSADGRLLATSRPDTGVPLQAAPGHGLLRTHDAWAPGWRVYTAPAAGPHQRRVQVLQSEKFLQEEVAVRTLYVIVPMALLVPALLFTLWLVVGRASRSLRLVADEVAQRDDRSLGAIRMDRVPEEIVPLVGSFNALLARLGEAFAAQRRFVQDAAHELRTPMAAMALQLENLRPFVPAGDAQQQFAQLDAGMRRARHLVGQLLRLSRQEAPVAAQASAAPVDITALLRDSVGQLMPLADQRRIDVGFAGDGQVAVHAAASELRSVFDNLLDNALRYTPEGGAVEVRLHRLDSGAVVDIMDTGPGIPPDLLERVFDRFFRVPGNDADGSGLGLAITRAAALRQGLRVELRARDDGAAGLLARVHLPPPQPAPAPLLTPA